LPPDQKAIDQTSRIILIRGSGAPAARAIVDGFRAEVANLDARIPLSEISVGAEHLSWARYIPRLAAQLGLLLGVLALALAAMGIYSLMTYTVSQRTKEIGIRIALGGRVRDVLKLVMGQALALVMVGVVVGTVAALVVTRFLTAFLYNVGAADPLTVAGTVAVLVLLAMLATLLPARRAARVDPMVALRYE
jgi:putative ABC transport system permease protein